MFPNGPLAFLEIGHLHSLSDQKARIQTRDHSLLVPHPITNSWIKSFPHQQKHFKWKELSRSKTTGMSSSSEDDPNITSSKPITSTGLD